MSSGSDGPRVTQTVHVPGTPLAQVLCENCLVAHVAHTPEELKALERCPVCDTTIMEVYTKDELR